MIGNIIAAAVVLIAIGLALWKTIKDRKKGGGCGCGCDKCDASQYCHKE
jgi:hypothetical protein